MIKFKYKLFYITEIKSYLYNIKVPFSKLNLIRSKKKEKSLITFEVFIK